MNDLISPKYQMKLVNDVEQALWNEFSEAKYTNVRHYIEKWKHPIYSDGYGNEEYNFYIVTQPNSSNIDLKATLHQIDGETLLKIAIDLGVDTPDFIPSIPTFKNALKSEYITAYDTFVKAYKQIETDPSLAIGLANSALESIVKEILKDDRINSKTKGGETLYELSKIILKEFSLFPDSVLPKEIKTIGSSFLSANQSIEGLRSEKTNFHGKTTEDYLITEPLYAYFVVNSVSTVGTFLISFYKTKYPKQKVEKEDESDNLPF